MDPPPVTCDVTQVFVDRCGGCHAPPEPNAGLDLVSPGVGDRVANRPATQSSGVLADPSDPTDSVIYQRVQDPNASNRMPPPVFDPMTEEEVMCLRDWISGLVPPPPVMVDAMPLPDGMQECQLGEMMPCYEGPSAAEDLGVCTGGVRSCVDVAGTPRWGACDGQVFPSPERCSTTEVDEDCDGKTESCAERTVWVFSLAFPYDNESVRSVAVDGDDNIFVAGDFAAGIDLGDGPILSAGPSNGLYKNDPFLAKYDATGELLWKRTWGDTSTQNAAQVVTDAAGNAIILGRAFGKIDFGGGELDARGTDDIFIAKFGPNGQHLWSNMVGGMSDDRAERMTVDSNGDVWVAGRFTGEAQVGNESFTSTGAQDALVFELDASTGAVNFAMHAGGAVDDGGTNIGANYAFGIDVDNSDNVYVAGFFMSTMQVGLDSQGDPVTLTSTGERDVFVFKMAQDGTIAWAERFGGPRNDNVYDLVVDRSNSSVWVTGYFQDSIDFGGGAIATDDGCTAPTDCYDLFLAKLDTDGGHLFSAGYGDDTDQQYYDTFDTNTWSSLDIDGSGNVYFAAPLVGSATFGANTLTSPNQQMDVLFVKFNSSGTPLYSALFGGNGTQIPLDVAVAGSGHAVLGGRFFSSTLDFGNAGVAQGVGLRGDISSGGDAFVARIPSE